jgi:hypothetical protein
VRSLFRFAKKRGLIFADPTTRLRAEDTPRSLLPMTDAEVLAVQQIAVTPAQRLIVALAAVHAARATAVRSLTLAGHGQRLGELLYQGVHLEHIRGDRVLHEALTVGADPLHLTLVFNLSHTTGRAGALDGCPEGDPFRTEHLLGVVVNWPSVCPDR